MSRYTGPKAKISRKYGEPILGNAKVLKKKNYPPGQHGRKQRKKSEYGIQLKEKNKVKHIYGVLEKQFANLFHKAANKKGVTGELLLQALETRLDNVTYRLGMAPTRRSARQLVSHGHILVNSKKVNIPSYAVKVGDMISFTQKAQTSTSLVSNIDAQNSTKVNWLEWDSKKMIGKIMTLPLREEVLEKINEQSIVELYSK